MEFLTFGTIVIPNNVIDEKVKARIAGGNRAYCTNK
jgi:hypothetical protein